MSVSYNNYRLKTRAVRAGQIRTEFDETSEALFMTSGYVYSSAEEAEATFKNEKNRFRYSRISNPTVDVFQKRLALIEGAKRCHSLSSGMSATFVLLTSLLKKGDRVVAGSSLFSSSTEILKKFLPRWGIECEFVIASDLEQWSQALKKPTTAVLIETPSNPLLELTDIQAVAKLASNVGAKVIVDNVFASPIGQSPLKLGADFIYYSATKHIDGQGRVLGGAILHNDEDFADNYLSNYISHTGPILSPFNAWVLLKGLETLPIRVEVQSKNALKIAHFLEGHPSIEKVYYPGLPSFSQHKLAKQQMSLFGTVMTFSVTGGKKEAFKVLNRLKLIDISNNLGDSKSLATHPMTTTHQSLDEEDSKQQGLKSNQIRLSIGLEDCDDLIEDLNSSL